MPRKVIPYGTKLPVTFRVADVEMMTSQLFFDPAMLRAGIAEGKKLIFKLSLDDIEELQGAVAAEMNHTKDKKLAKQLQVIFEYLQQFMNRYDDQALS